MGIYAPTLGIIGAVLGLIAVMKNLAGPEQARPWHRRRVHRHHLRHRLGQPVVPAGFGQAQERDRAQASEREMVIEGLISIAQGENPRNIETKLSGFLD
jgi:chemotaxis protein MotA